MILGDPDLEALDQDLAAVPVALLAFQILPPAVGRAFD